MGQKEWEIQLPCGYSDTDLDKAVRNRIRSTDISYKILRKSLDSRRKDNIHWQLRVQVSSNSIPGQPGRETVSPETLAPRKGSGKGKKVLVAGSGPAGIFAALFLQKSGCRVTLLERGTPVEVRHEDIRILETEGTFTPDSNYSFGEGGAGTFSDGKLTSRSKHIKKEKQYILEEFVRMGAPDEILYLTHPHIGSDNLIRIAQNMRRSFQDTGGRSVSGRSLRIWISKTAGSGPYILPMRN